MVARQEEQATIQVDEACATYLEAMEFDEDKKWHV